MLQATSDAISKRRVIILLVISGLCAMIWSYASSSDGILPPFPSRSSSAPKSISESEDVNEFLKEESQLERDQERGTLRADDEKGEKEPQAEGEPESRFGNEDADDEDEQDPGFEPAPRTHNGPYNDIQPGVRYLLYSPSGGFNNQREELADAIQIAHLLNRTLYVPMAGRHTNFFSAYEKLHGPADLFPMDRILDFPYIETYGVRLVPLNTTTLRMAARFIHQMGEKAVEILYHPEAPSPIETWHEHDVYAMRAIKKPLLFIRGRGFYHRWFPNPVMTQVKRHTRYSEYLRRLSVKIVESTLGKTFYAMHIRLGDYKARYKDVPGFVGGFVRSGWAKNWKAKRYPVYVATDDVRKTQEEFGSIYKAYPKLFFAENIPKELVHEFRALFPPRSQMKEDMMGILEQLICAQATDFVGTPTSTFSAWINFMRALRVYTFPEVGAVGSRASALFTNQTTGDYSHNLTTTEGPNISTQNKGELTAVEEKKPQGAIPPKAAEEGEAFDP